MKKTLLVIMIAVLAGSTIFTSCVTSDLKVAEKELTGNTWILDGFETPDDTFSEMFSAIFELFTVSYNFKKDYTYTVTTTFFIASDSEDGTWSISDDGKYLTIDGDQSEIISIDSKELILGPNSAIMGQVEDEEEDVIEGFDNYQIVFYAK